jgi:hypothetical protein
VIARTLGVVDATKASTAAPDHDDDNDDVPAIHVVDPTPPASASPNAHTGSGVSAAHESTTSYLRDSVVEEGNLKLSGVDAFSPAPSQPPSPTISRRDLSGGSASVGRMNVNGLPMTEMVPKSVDGEGSDGEGEGVQMRRRVRDRGGRDE